MKKMIFVVSVFVLMALPFNLVSAEESDGERLADYLVIPTKGQILSQLTYKSSDTSTKLTLLNVDIDTLTIKESKISYSLLYGYSDRLSFGFDLHNTLSKEARYDYVSSSLTDFSANSKGLYDPTFKLKGRLFENSDYKGNFNFSLSPKNVDAKLATKDNDGTMGKGGTDIEVGLDLGTPLKSNQIGVAIKYILRGSRDIDYADGSYRANQSGGNTLNAMIGGQLVISPGITGGLFYLYEDSDSTTIDYKALKSGNIDYKMKFVKYVTQYYGLHGAFEINQDNLIYITYQSATANNVDYDLTISGITGSGSLKDIKGTEVSIGWMGRF